MILICISLSLLPVSVFAEDGMSDFKDTKAKDFVEVVKGWIGDKLSSESPDMGLSTQKPSKDKGGYSN